MSKAIVVRVAGNAPCPDGFTPQGVATRRTKLCVKIAEAPEVEMATVAASLPAPAPAPPVDPSVDDLTGLLAGMTMNQPFVVDVNQLSALMGGLGMSGGSRRHSRRKAHRKSHRKSHRKAHRKSHRRSASRKTRRQA